MNADPILYCRPCIADDVQTIKVNNDDTTR